MKIALTAIVLLLPPVAAAAQQTTIYGRDGKAVGRATTDSQGTTTFYDAATGRATARSSTPLGGTTTTIYDATTGRRTGTIQNGSKPK